MVSGDVSGMFLAISRSTETEYISQLYPHKLLTTVLMAAMAGASTRGVRWV